MRRLPLLVMSLSMIGVFGTNSCAPGPGKFVGKESGKKSEGNAPLVGPTAGDLIRQSRYDYERRQYLDRLEQDKARRR
ncbi:hypothetical protein JIN85_12905 [Luteolibacter pohnpeiensis]|uniref:Uncharacterized protein n=2 Tax=Luteolibacter pohnpeiensis TaxID=454153 RepID=A0A934S8R2_9BACT|nr:hypothetical protein [Luteolibacter pohnpeiensis]